MTTGQTYGRRIVSLFDFDDAGFGWWTGLKREKEVFQDVETDASKGLLKRWRDKPLWGMLLPVPTYRRDRAGLNFGQNSQLCIELMFEELDLVPNMIDVTALPGGGSKWTIKNGKKAAFAEAVKSLSADAFAPFKPLFDTFEGLRTHPA